MRSIPRHLEPFRIQRGIHRIIDLSHEVGPYPGGEISPPPPPFTHVEPFGHTEQDVNVRAGIFHYMKLAHFSLFDARSGQSGRFTEINTTTQYPIHIEGPYPGYLRPNMYGDLKPDQKNVPKHSAQMPLSALVRECTIIDYEAGPEEEIPLSAIKKHEKIIGEGDMVFIRTGFRKRYADTDQANKWPYCEAGTTGWLVEEKGSRFFGTDAGGVDAPHGSAGEERNHQDLHMSGGAPIEGGLDFSGVAGNKALALVLPLRIRGLDAGIGRAIALVGPERQPVDVSPVLTAHEVFADGAAWQEPLTEKAEILRRVKILPFNVDNSLVDQCMYVTFNNHMGTHIEISDDYPGSADVAGIPPESLAGDAVVIDVPKGPLSSITAGDLEHADILQGQRVLLRSGYSDWYYGRSDFYDLSPSLSIDAVEYLLARGVSLLGVDFPSIESQKPLEGSAPSGQLHRIFFDAGVPIVENLTNMRYIKRKRCFFAALPLKIAGIGACPVRALALEWEQ
jgi:arylformamidase